MISVSGRLQDGTERDSSRSMLRKKRDRGFREDQKHDSQRSLGDLDGHSRLRPEDKRDAGHNRLARAVRSPVRDEETSSLRDRSSKDTARILLVSSSRIWWQLRKFTRSIRDRKQLTGCCKTVCCGHHSHSRKSSDLALSFSSISTESGIILGSLANTTGTTGETAKIPSRRAAISSGLRGKL